MNRKEGVLDSNGESKVTMQLARLHLYRLQR